MRFWGKKQQQQQQNSATKSLPVDLVPLIECLRFVQFLIYDLCQVNSHEMTYSFFFYLFFIFGPSQGNCHNFIDGKAFGVCN